MVTLAAGVLGWVRCGHWPVASAARGVVGADPAAVRAAGHRAARAAPGRAAGLARPVAEVAQFAGGDCCSSSPSSSRAGDLAALLSLPWLAVTALISLEGLLRIARRGLAPLSDLCRDAGLVFLLVGGLWTTASRWGMRPLDFDEAIVLLTANHFHYAGFVRADRRRAGRRRTAGADSARSR